MPKALPRLVRDHLEKARAAALAAVEAYNKPGPRFRTAHYIVLMTMAWTALFHAVFIKSGRRPWYRKKTSGKGKGIRYVYLDGEPKHWELAECLDQYYQDRNPPERSNLRFLIGLRNRIEHRHLPELDPRLFGECQAALTNFDETVVKEFGARHALGESLGVSLQFSKITPPQKAAAIKLQLAAAGKRVVHYIDTFRSALPEEVFNDPRYSFRVYLLPKVTGKPGSADLAVEFVPYDSSADSMEHLKKVAALIKERQVPVANLGLLKPGQVVAQVKAHLPFPFNGATHVRAWQYYGVRPKGGASSPEKTKAKYCVFDGAHSDYLYTGEWVEMLCKQLSDPTEYKAVAGKAAPQTAQGTGKPSSQLTQGSQ
jgi:hypothetical protein